MEVTKKMMLVPAGKPDPLVTQMSQLDKQMDAILKNNKLSTFEKIKLYNQVLRKHILLDNRFKNSFKETLEQKANEEIIDDASDLIESVIKNDAQTSANISVSSTPNVLVKSQTSPKDAVGKHKRNIHVNPNVSLEISPENSQIITNYTDDEDELSYDMNSYRIYPWQNMNNYHLIHPNLSASNNTNTGFASLFTSPVKKRHSILKTNNPSTLNNTKKLHQQVLTGTPNFDEIAARQHKPVYQKTPFKHTSPKKTKVTTRSRALLSKGGKRHSFNKTIDSNHIIRSDLSLLEQNGEGIKWAKFKRN